MVSLLSGSICILESQAMVYSILFFVYASATTWCPLVGGRNMIARSVAIEASGPFRASQRRGTQAKVWAKFFWPLGPENLRAFARFG